MNSEKKTGSIRQLNTEKSENLKKQYGFLKEIFSGC